MCLPVHPFKIENEYEHAGLKCAVVQAREYEHRCGYVRIPPTHPAYNKNYDEINVDVHGGLTFARMEDCVEEDGIGYWVGFDFAHCDDAMFDPQAPLPQELFHRNSPNQHYYTNKEAIDETNYLALQLSKYEN